MYDTFMQGKDLYSEIASKAFNLSYEECLEHFPKGAFIKQVDKKWVYGSENDYEKIADGENDVYKAGKERRTQAKSILLGVLYGRQEASIAEQLGCTEQEAKAIKESVFRGFPAIKQFEQTSLDMAKELGYVTTVCGRKRRLPDLQLEEYEFRWKDGKCPYDDPLDFTMTESLPVPDERQMYYRSKFANARYFRDRQKVNAEAEREGIQIINNGKKISDATRQCVNARIQGCLSGDVHIQSKEFGIIKLSDFVNQKLTVWDGNEWTSGTILASGLKQKCVLKFSNKQEIICSPTHKFLTINTRGCEHFKELRELKIGDRILINQKFVDSDYTYSSDWAHIPLKAHNAMPHYLDRINNSFDIGLFLGRIASDGSYRLRENGGSLIRHIFAEHEFNIIPTMEKICSAFNYSLDVQDDIRESRNQRMGYINISNLSLTSEISMLDVKHRVHSNIFMDTQLLRGFISGFFDGDGGVTGDHSIVLTFGAQFDFSEMLSDLQKALLFMGIRSYKRVYAKSYKLYIKSADAKRFCDLIGFINPIKQEKASKISITKDLHTFNQKQFVLVKDIIITDEQIEMYDLCNTKNGYFIADGLVTHNSAADLTKLAMIKLSENEQLNELGFRMLIPVHDEIIAECPEEHAEECAKLLAQTMCKAAETILEMSIKCDVAVSKCWYGEFIEV